MAKRGGPTLIQRSRQVPDEQKALYHQVLGAGKARVIRKFLGLTPADETAIRERLGKGIRENLARGVK